MIARNYKFKKILIICSLFIAYCLLFSNADAFDAKRTVLPNGLILLHSENHSLPLVMITLAVKAGQINETEDKAGLANLVAEVITEGTKKRSSKEISEEIDYIGASLDASTGKDLTTIKLSVLKKDIHKGLELFADILLNPSFPEEEVERKKERIKGFLIKLEEEPSFLAERALRKEIFGEHPYGRIVEGSPESIAALKREDVVDFYSQYYIPSNAIMSVAGDLTSEELRGLIERYLYKWQKKGVPVNVQESIRNPDVLQHTNKRRADISCKNKIIRKVIKINKDLTQANIVLGGPGIKRNHPDFCALTVMNYILGGGGFSSRLMQSVRDEMGLAYDVYSYIDSYKYAGMLQIGLQTKNESTTTAINEILRQIRMISIEFVSEKELADAKSYLTGSFKRKFDTNRKIADFLSYVEFYNLGLDYVEKYPQCINSITNDDVLEVAKKYLDTTNFVLAILADQEKATFKYQE